MNILHKTIFCISLAFTLPTTNVLANEMDQGDIYFSGYTPNLWQSVKNNLSQSDYTVLDAAEYQQNIINSRIKIQNLLDSQQLNHSNNLNARIAFIGQQLSNIPYIFTGAMGEGDWLPASSVYQAGAVHVKQDPVYRLDGLDCQTFVQVAMSLLYSKDINEFDQNILKISYGAAGNSLNEIVHYYNRNNFVDGDWNPINHHHGWLTDVTTEGPLADFAKITYADITRQNWFLTQQNNLSSNIRVLSDIDGPTMAKRFTTEYSTLDFPNFDSEIVPTSYIPKEKLAIHNPTEVINLIILYLI